jgi:hypothetical protein
LHEFAINTPFLSQKTVATDVLAHIFSLFDECVCASTALTTFDVIEKFIAVFVALI